MERSHEEIARRFPAAKFHVLVWDPPLTPSVSSELAATVTRPGIDVHHVKAAFLDYQLGFDPRYQFCPGDRHPRPAAYALVSDYVVSEVLHDAP